MCDRRCKNYRIDLAEQFAVAIAPSLLKEYLESQYSKFPTPIETVAADVWRLAKAFADAELASSTNQSN